MAVGALAPTLAHNRVAITGVYVSTRADVAFVAMYTIGESLA